MTMPWKTHMLGMSTALLLSGSIAIAQEPDAMPMPVPESADMTQPVLDPVESTDQASDVSSSDAIDLSTIIPQAKAAGDLVVQSLPKLDLAKLEKRRHQQILPLLKNFFEENYVSSMVSLQQLSSFTPIAKGEAQLRKVKLPGFDTHAWVPVERQKGVGFVEQPQTFATIVVLIQNKVPEGHVDALKRELGFQIPQFDFEFRDVLRVMVLPEAFQPVDSKKNSNTLGSASSGMASSQPEAISPQDELEYSQWLLKARTAYFNKDLQGALDAVNRAVELAPGQPQGYEMLGSIYYALNWKKQALDKWEHALKLDPQNKKIKNYLQQLKREQP